MNTWQISWSTSWLDNIGDDTVVVPLNHQFWMENWIRGSQDTCTLIICDLWRLNLWPEVTFDEGLIKRTVQKLSIGIICVILASTVPDATARFLKNIIKSIELWPLMTSGDPNIALRGKMTEILLKVLIKSYRMLFYRVFLSLLVFELQGGDNILSPTPTHYD